MRCNSLPGSPNKAVEGRLRQSTLTPIDCLAQETNERPVNAFRSLELRNTVELRGGNYVGRLVDEKPAVNSKNKCVVRQTVTPWRMGFLPDF